MRSLFDALDGIDALTDQLGNVSASIAKLDALQPKLLALIPPQIANQQTNRDLTMTNYATTSGIYDQTAAALQNATALGQAYDASKTDDSFYLPPEAFTNPEFQRGLKLFLSPDGKAARMIITHDGDPATPEGISHIDAIRHAAQEAVKGTPLAGSKIYIAGTAATYKDIQDGAKYDLMIAGIAALSLILLIMMFITRSLVAALVIVGTVALSLGASFGLSVLVWQDIFGIELYWIVLALAVILLLAVGSDYNLLLISRFKEEIGAGLNTGIIRAMAGTGAVVTAAGLVFAATMASFMFADLRILGQIGTTIALGLLFDTLIVRSFMTPSIAALLGRWFWWPLKVRTRPASQMLQPYGSRHAVRQLLLWEDGDPAIRPKHRHALNHDDRVLLGSSHFCQPAIVGGRLGSSPTTGVSSSDGSGTVNEVLQTPFQPCDPAQLGGDVHGGQHGDAPDERSKGGVAAISMQHVETANHVKESHGEEGGGYRVRER